MNLFFKDRGTSIIDTRITLEPGQTKVASIKVQAENLAYFNIIKNAWEIEQIEYSE